MRRTNRLPLDQLAPYLLEVPEDARLLVWQDIFGNDHPVEIEVGFGKGLFLLTSALANPAVNFVGIEVMRKYQLFAATRMAKRGLANIRLAKADARAFLRDRLAPASVRAMHVYFPDPWWKKRHQKRRVFTGEFARECQRVLAPGGRLHIATDVEEYFGVMSELVNQQTRLSPAPASAFPMVDGKPMMTNFERKAHEEGTAVHRAAWEKTEG